MVPECNGADRPPISRFGDYLLMLTAHEAGTRANASTGGLYGQHAYIVTE